MKIQTEDLTFESAGELDAADCTEFILPKIATGSRPTASTTYEGMLIYNSTTKKLNICTHAAWQAITSST